MSRAVGRQENGLLCLAVTALLLAASPAKPVENRTVDQFVQLSQAFHQRLPRSGLAGLGAEAQRNRAVCILTRFESGYGSDGVAALMRLMSVISKGAEFDDPNIIAFNERFGGSYDRIVGDCTRAAAGS